MKTTKTDAVVALRPVDLRVFAQSVVFLAFVLVAIFLGWLMVTGVDWYVPTLVAIVAARFAFDRFFAEG